MSVRYYFSSTKLSPFLGSGIDYYNFGNSISDGINFHITTGLNNFLSYEVALESFVAYHYSSFSNNTNTSSNIQLGIGVAYFLTILR